MGHSDRTGRSDAAIALALLVLGIVLCILGAGQLAQWQDTAAHQQGWTVEVLLAAAATAAGLGLLLWWAFSMLAAGASVLLERLGRNRAAATARRLSPAFMQRAVIAALSMQLIAGAAAHAATTAPGPEWTPTHEQSSAAYANPAAAHVAPTPRQGTGPALHFSVQPGPAEVPPPGREAASPAWQSTAALPTAATPSPGWQPASPVVEPGLLAAPETRTAAGTEPDPRATGGGAGPVTVLAGDTLWDIVAAQLGPEASDVDIALEWPRWYAANRGLIGGSPDVLLPGQILQAPQAP
ncbi:MULTISPECIES: LysM peptidoglycan-binding domain-containing protein [Micrococcaceae]|uniref:LysM peptidoglycan-binding domain-containing protein n=1 Tax=Micrococcaceae TaxID=1268 RepID=UPI0012F42446|nr:hypothetical protein [Arthrobacter sp. 8AJ]VXB20647.1 conserved exported hypothetical protein [Arthrobacter sp. 8AJ]